ncbi:MAG: amino acid adenylation domain-containing protein [Candidatus Bipolaricaulota bacterium]
MEKRRNAPIDMIPRLSCGPSALPLSFAQDRMWFLEQLNPGTPLYNIPWAVRLTGALDVGALRRSLDALVERHATLRTTYQAKAGVPHQVVRKSTPFPFNRVDLRGGSRINRDVKLQQLLSEEARRPFDLTSDCMLRATVAQLTYLEHVLLLITHHIAVDGWSQGILNRELGIIYESLLRGSEPVLPDLPIQYTDYAAWQRDEARNNELDRELEYWRTKLERPAPTLNLPTSCSPIAEDTLSGGRVPISIPEELVMGIRQLASKLNITPFMILASAVMVTLCRYTGETDIAIGIPIEGRTRLETESLVGLFVNTLVLRGDLSGQPSFAEVLQRVKRVCVEAHGHQEVPFERIVADLGAEWINDRSSIIQIMLAYRSLPPETLSLAGTNATPIDVRTDTSKFDLSFDLWETQQGLAGTLVYSRQLFSEARMRDLAAHFVRLLEAGVDESEQAIGEMPMLSPKERKRILVDWNAATAPEPQETTIHRLFERAATAAPHATAVVCSEDRLTYGDLNDRAARLASYLRGLGVHPGELVGILMHRSTDLIVGLLGILKAGAAYLPLDPRFPPDRLRLMVEDAAIRALLTQSDLVASLPSDTIQTVQLDVDWPAIARLEPAASIDSQPEQLAYVMYTSGSTGRPKGVMITHRNVVGFLNAFRHVVDASPRRISTNVITYAFDISVEEIFSPLCYGGTLHVVPDETTLDGRSLAHYILDHEINTAYIVPDLLPSVAETFEKHGGCGDLACLRTGLAPKRERVLQRFREISPSLKIINAYGPTEVTYGATAYEFDSATDPERDVPIGRPFPNYQVYIVNDMLEPVPVGVTGEILIGGVGVSRGYLNRPDLTAERFTTSPFLTDPVERLFKTGDLGRYLDDGTIEFLGRGDRQVKIRGHRIELREIELAVESHPQVTACYAVTCTLAEDDVRLAAYVAWAGDRPGDESALRKHLQHQLPSFMLPSMFVFSSGFPLLPSGKIDRRALPQPEWGNAWSADRYIPPTSETEVKLVQIWKEVLKLDRVGITDNFFELGGHSLLAIRVISRIEEALNVQIPIRIQFERSTIAELASFIHNASTNEETV